MTPSDEVYEDICHKLWYLGLFRSVRAFEKLIGYLGNKGLDYEIEWTGDFDVKDKLHCIRMIINHEDIHTSIHIIIDIYDDYKTKSTIASWEKYLNNLFNEEESKMVEQRCDNCRYFKLGVFEEPCRCCNFVDDTFSNWESKDDDEMVMIDDLFEDAKRDVEEVKKAAEEVNKLWAEYLDAIRSSNKPAAPKMPGIEDVIFNGPATIVKWSDGTKTVVKAQKGKNGRREKLNPEKGLAMAICKKVYGNDGRYYDIFKKWIN